MYLLGASHQGQQNLLAMIEAGKLHLAEIRNDIGRVAALMSKYQDVPMDFADASQVAVAEREGLDTIFTLDIDFHVYRVSSRRAFRVVP